MRKACYLMFFAIPWVAGSSFHGRGTIHLPKVQFNIVSFMHIG